MSSAFLRRHDPDQVKKGSTLSGRSASTPLANWKAALYHTPFAQYLIETYNRYHAGQYQQSRARTSAGHP